MQIGDYIRTLKSRLAPLFKEKKALATGSRCCIYLSPNEISIIQVNNSQETYELLFAETLKYETLDNLPLVLTAFVDKHQLSNIPAYWLLSPEEYQLFLIESLPVKPDEFHDALNWRIKSLLSYPIEQAVIDYFKFPPKKSTQTTSMIAAVVTKMDYLAKVTDIFKTCGLPLTIIDIPELALRNLTAPYENDEKSTAFIYFFENAVILNITRQQTLYFTRRLNLMTENQSDKKDYEQVGLDILRYFDYFQSQWRFPTPSRVFVGADKKELEPIAKALADYLLVSVEPYKIKNIQLDEEKLHRLETKFLLPFGCVIRSGEANATTGD